MPNLLRDRTAVVYGGGGSIGGAAARAFAREGARVFVAGRTRERLDAVVREIEAVGGAARAAVLDALDEQAVAQMIAGMAALRRTPTLADVAETLTFLASDHAAGITGTMINVTCGLVLK